MTDPAFILDVLRTIAAAEMHDSLWWRVDGDDLTFYINCNDVFFWGSGDVEEITPENLPLLKQTIADLNDLESSLAFVYGDSLFCARSRRERPQGACYPNGRPEIWPLFDACGPEKPVGLGNPYKPGEKKSA